MKYTLHQLAIMLMALAPYTNAASSLQSALIITQSRPSLFDYIGLSVNPSGKHAMVIQSAEGAAHIGSIAFVYSENQQFCELQDKLEVMAEALACGANFDEIWQDAIEKLSYRENSDDAIDCTSTYNEMILNDLIAIQITLTKTKLSYLGRGASKTICLIDTREFDLQPAKSIGAWFETCCFRATGLIRFPLPESAQAYAQRLQTESAHESRLSMTPFALIINLPAQDSAEATHPQAISLMPPV